MEMRLGVILSSKERSRAGGAKRHRKKHLILHNIANKICTDHFKLRLVQRIAKCIARLLFTHKPQHSQLSVIVYFCPQWPVKLS